MRNRTKTSRVVQVFIIFFGCFLTAYGCGGGGGGGAAASTPSPEETGLVAEAYDVFQDSYYDTSRIHAPAAGDTLETYVNSYSSLDDIYTKYYDADRMAEINESLSSNEETIVKSFGTVLYIAFNRFAVDTADRIIQIIEDGINAGHDRLILDLRLNGGGLPGESADLLEYFLGSQNPGVLLGILEIRGSSSPRFLSSNSYRETFFDAGNMWILTSAATASAAEILVADLVYYNEATQVGTTTFGKNRLVSFETTIRGDGYEYTVGIIRHADGLDREGIGIIPENPFNTTDPFGYLMPGYTDPLITEFWISADDLPMIYDRDALRYRQYMAAIAGLRPLLLHGLIRWELE